MTHVCNMKQGRCSFAQILDAKEYLGQQMNTLASYVPSSRFFDSGEIMAAENSKMF